MKKSSKSSKDTLKLYDLSTIQKIDSDPSFVKSIIDLFISSVQKDIEHLKKIRSEGTWNELTNLAHKMRSSIQHFNLRNMDDQLEALENAKTPYDEKDLVNKILTVLSALQEVIIGLKEESLLLSKN